MKRYLKTPEEVIKALKEGKVVKSKNVKYRLIDGIICSFNKENGRKMWTVCNSISEYEKAYIDEPEPFKIEVGKWYETHDHQKARCVLKYLKEKEWSLWKEEAIVYYKNGKIEVFSEKDLDDK